MFDHTTPGARGVWDATLHARLTEINQQLIEALRESALASDAAYRVPPLIALLGEDWRALDAAAARRLATCPYLLLDAGFAQPGRWERPSGAAVMDAAASGGYFQHRNGVALLRRALVFAWHLANCNPPMARICLGVGAASAEHIAHASLKDLELVAEQSPAWITPRFERQPRVWRQLLRAARAGDAAALRVAQLRGLQLLAVSEGARAGH